MQMIKKVISVILAVIMIVSAFAFSSFAGAPAPSGSYKVTMAYELVDADGNPVTTVTPGSTVTLNVYANSSTVNDELYGFIHSIYYDDSIYLYVAGSLKWLGIADWIDKANSDETVQNATVGDNTYTASSKLWTAAEKADEPNWDSFIQVTGIQDADGAAYYVQENANSPMYSLDFKVAEDATPGASANFGCPASVNYANRKTYCYTRTYTGTGTIGAGEIEPVQKYLVTVASDAEKSIITPISSQIRFRGIGANGVGTYDNEFDVRTRATIAEADFNAAFGDDVAALDKIADIGFVYASTTDVPDFDMETAIKVAKGEDVDGIADAAKYTKKSCKYIQHADGQYMLTCVITGIKDTTANKEDGVNCIAYVRDIDGNFYCYDAASPASYGQLYEAHRSNFPA